MKRTLLTTAMLAGSLSLCAAGIKGDIDGDGRLTMDDVNALAAVLAGQSATNAQTDLNGDGVLSVCDVTLLVDMVLNKKEGGMDVGIGGWDDSGEDYGGTVCAPFRWRASSSSGPVSLSMDRLLVRPGGTAEAVLSMDCPVPVNGFQATVSLPAGLELVDASLSRSGGTHVLRRGGSGGKITLVSYSTSNAAYPNSAGDLLTLVVKGSATAVAYELEFSSLELSDASFSAIRPDDFSVPATVSEHLSLRKGWNWATLNFSNASTGAELLGAFDDKGMVTRLVGPGSEIVNDPALGHVGNLSAIDPVSMYKVLLDGPASVLYASLASPKEVSLRKGWNWIGYQPGVSMPLTDALAGLQADEGDMIVGFEDIADYTSGSGWKGTLERLETGLGYMYYSVSAKSFTYPSAPSQSMTISFHEAASSSPALAPAAASASGWEVDTHLYPDRLPVVARLTLGGEDVGENYTVGAFCGSECRGVGKLVDGRVYINVCGSSASDVISFLAHDNASGAQLPVNETVPFGSGALGSYSAPFALTIGGTADAVSAPQSSPAPPRQCFTLSGARVSPSALRGGMPAGLYIVDGKKVMVGR